MVEQFNSWLPETQDSYCKAQLKKLISETLEDMRRNEATVTQQQKLEAIAPVTLEKEEINKEPEAPIVTQQEKPEVIAPATQEKEEINKEPEAPIVTQQEKPEAIAPGNQGKEEIHKEPVAPIATQQQKNQVIVPEASANKETEASIKTYQQKFRTIAEEAAQKALDRARLKAQIEHQSKFALIAQQAATKARAKMLHKQMDKYLTFVEQFAVIVLDLQQKQKHNANYKNVTQVALNLYGKLKDAALFFEQPSAEGFEVFKQFCNGSINEAAGVFKQHRDLWHTIHPILKGILGVVAALTVIPALLVATTKTGYINTFFKTPETASSKKLHQIKEMLESVEDEMEQKIKMQ